MDIDSDASSMAGSSAAATPAASSVASLVSSYHRLRQTLQPSSAERPDQHDPERDMHAWCMEAIQTLTQIAPAVRRSALVHGDALSSGVASLQQAHASLVLQFLTAMLHHVNMDAEERRNGPQPHQQVQEGSSADAQAARPLLPFLYANLFKYALNLQEYDAYYHLLTQMPASFAPSPSSPSSPSTSSSSPMQLEYLKRFVLELLRERRVEDIVRQYRWSFEWNRGREGKGEGRKGERTVREEVEEMLWWHARSSDMSDELTAGLSTASQPGGATTAPAGGHYEILYAFLLSSHRYHRAAQAALHYYYRLESDVSSSGGLAQFIGRRVSQAQKGRGRPGVTPSGLHMHDRSLASVKSLTVSALRSFFHRQLWALRSVQHALEKADPGDGEATFMLEGATTPREQEDAQADQETNSPLAKRARSQQDDEAMDGGLGFGCSSTGEGSIPTRSISLLTRAQLDRRLALLLTQVDLVSALDSGPISLPPLDSVLEMPPTLREFAERLAKHGLVERAIEFVKRAYEGRAGLEGEYEEVRVELLKSLAARVVRMTLQAAAAASEEEVPLDATSEEDLYPLRLDDSLSALELLGRGVGRVGGSASEPLALRQANAALQYLLEQHDPPSSGRATEAVAEQYLKFGLDLPLWLRDRVLSCLDSSPEEEGEEKDDGLTFRVQASEPVSEHRRTVRSFPFLAFLRLLLAYGRYELLYQLANRYLTWLSSARGAAGARDASYVTLTDILDAFLALQDHARSSRPPVPKEVREQVDEWTNGLVEQAKVRTGGKVTSGHGDTGKRASVPRPAQSFGTSANVTFGGNSGFQSRFQPQDARTQSATQSTPAPAVPSASLRFWLAPTAAAAPAPQSSLAPSPFASFSSVPSFGAAPASSSALSSSTFGGGPLKSPFADDFSTAATPSKQPMGGAGGFGGFGAFGTPAAQGSAGTSGTPFSFTPAATPASSTKPTAAPSTANLIFQSASANNASTGTPSATPFSFGGFK